jgi:cellulose synthase/poly-beta-1,6-N-acetylglucosamine synthase-like glycosyltransferase
MTMVELFKTAWMTAGTLAAIASLPGSIELLLLTVGNLLPQRKNRSTASVHKPFRMAVVVPAHNEAISIASCIESLKKARSADAKTALVVVADNCTDNTAEIAETAGVRVLVRQNEDLRGKGYALAHAFQVLLAEGHDAVLVVDADTEVAPNFLLEMRKQLESGADAVQCRYLVRNPEESVRTRLMALALRAFNVVRPRGRSGWGLSCGILGNGFGLSSKTLAAVPYRALSVVEDLEYHIFLVRSGRKVTFVDSTTVYGVVPARGAGVQTQRARWEGGRFRMIRENTPGLLLDVLQGKFSSLELLLELLLLPLAFHVTLLTIAIFSLWLPASLCGIAGFTVVLVHLAQAITLGGNWKDAMVLIAAPFYIFWKLLLVPRLLKHARVKTTWDRTERAGEK